MIVDFNLGTNNFILSAILLRLIYNWLDFHGVKVCVSIQQGGEADAVYRDEE